MIRTALAKEPEERYPTCAALIAAAEDALGLRTPPAGRSQWRLLAGALTAAIADETET